MKKPVGKREHPTQSPRWPLRIERCLNDAAAAINEHAPPGEVLEITTTLAARLTFFAAVV